MYPVKKIADIRYTDLRDRRNAFDLYLPEGKSGCPLFLFFYGGGLEAGCKEEQDEVGREFASAGIALAAPDYRLYPEVTYPSFIEDAADAVAFIQNHIGAYADITKTFVGGYSAGCYLAMMLCFDKRYLGKRGLDSDAFGGYIFLSGQTTAHFNVLAKKGLDPRRIIVDETAPLYYVREKGAPILIITSDNDMPNRYEQNMLLAGTLKHYAYSSPVEVRVYNGVEHGGFLRKEVNGSSYLFAAAGKFIGKLCGR